MNGTHEKAVPKTLQRNVFRRFVSTQKREARHVVTELLAVRGLMPLLMKSRNGNNWSAEEKAELIIQLRRLHPDQFAFLPGQREILRTAERLEGRFGTDTVIAPLYGNLGQGEQDQAIRPAPAGKRKIVLATGATSAIAGSSSMSGSADGTGSAALFDSACGLAADGMGNLYVADSRNSTIRKIVLSTGTVTTVAGSAGLSGSSDGTGGTARFGRPTSLALDGAGNLYVADASNSTVRKVTLATGMVTTIAGTAGMTGSVDGIGAAARFSTPAGIAVDTAGNLYVADSSNHNVRKIIAATGAVSTLAGAAGIPGSVDNIGAAARFRAPEGIAVDSAGGNLYIADRDNFTLRRIALATNAVSTLAGSAGTSGSIDGSGTTARFNAPSGVFMDSAGNLYVADTSNGTVRKVVPNTAAVSTLAGTASMLGSADGTGATARFRGIYGIAADGFGSVYVADGGNSTLRKVVLATGEVSTIAGTAGMLGSTDGIGASARFKVPYGLAADRIGNLYVTDLNNHTIRKVVLATGAVSTIAGTVGISGSADGMGAAAQFSSPTSLSLDDAGNLYIADAANYTIRKLVLATGAVSTIAGTAGMAGSADGTGAAARFKGVYGMVADGQGSLVIADAGSHSIRKLVLASGVVSTIAGTVGMPGATDGVGTAARFNAPYGIAVDTSGTLYVADTGNSTIRKLAPANGNVTTLVGAAGQAGVKPGLLPARLNTPASVTFASSGEFVIADLVENVILSAR